MSKSLRDFEHAQKCRLPYAIFTKKNKKYCLESKRKYTLQKTFSAVFSNHDAAADMTPHRQTILQEEEKQRKIKLQR